jgi:hypothetical protein
MVKLFLILDIGDVWKVGSGKFKRDEEIEPSISILALFGNGIQLKLGHQE